MGISWLNNNELMVCLNHMRDEIIGKTQELETELVANEMKLFEGAIREQAKLISPQEISFFRINEVPELLYDHENLEKAIQKENSRLAAINFFMQKLNASEEEKKSVVDFIQGFYYKPQ